MVLRMPTWQECKDAMPTIDRTTPVKVLNKAAWAVPVCFYSWATYETAKAVSSSAARIGLTCLKNPDTRLISHFLCKENILSLKDGLGCIDQTGQTIVLAGIASACLLSAIYCIKQLAAKKDSRLRFPPLPPGESPREAISVVSGKGAR